jgi:hypothetical protein
MASCEKQPYYSYSAACKAMLRIAGKSPWRQETKVYYCCRCRRWHLGSHWERRKPVKRKKW